MMKKKDFDLKETKKRQKLMMMKIEAQRLEWYWRDWETRTDSWNRQKRRKAGE
jgi:hypothetical protein